jgi:hypothetical protein
VGPSRGQVWLFWIVVFLGCLVFAPAVPVLFVGRRRWRWFGGASRSLWPQFMTRLGRMVFIAAGFLGFEAVALNAFASDIGRQDEHVAPVLAGPVIAVLSVVILSDLLAQAGAMFVRRIATRLR